MASPTNAGISWSTSPSSYHGDLLPAYETSSYRLLVRLDAVYRGREQDASHKGCVGPQRPIGIKRHGHVLPLFFLPSRLTSDLHTPHHSTNAHQLPKIMSTMNQKLSRLGRSTATTPKGPLSQSSSSPKCLPMVPFRISGTCLGRGHPLSFLGEYVRLLSLTEPRTRSSCRPNVPFGLKAPQSPRKGDGSRSRSTTPSLPGSPCTPNKVQLIHLS